MRKLASIALLIIALAAPKAFSWGFQGHEYIGNVTWAYLSPQAQTWVAKHLELVGEESLATTATWADRVRGTEEGRWMGPLHFANIPPEQTEMDLERDCPNRRCVVGATYNDLDVLLSTSASAQEKAEALRTLTHWITDIHQPLHLGFARDRGGNSLRLTYRDNETNLHSFWDSVIIRGKNLPEPARMAAEYPLPSAPSDLYAAVLSWANESNHLAREYAYAGIEQGSVVNEAYVERAKPIVRQQLVHAAQRLAFIIEAAAAQDRS
ncbi:S1/P1 nuclease [Aliidiomarina celeris]|uniref:S1/P1 nuclease n=1 Tax=Aliidiomarina celeris TaxID=2249428 RepID=UPI000DE9395E|nr:S1/P1 nuclease [Aliidiomarina celeris]